MDSPSQNPTQGEDISPMSHEKNAVFSQHPTVTLKRAPSLREPETPWREHHPLWTDAWQAGISVLGTSLALIFGIFSVLQWQVAQQSQDQANTANLFALLEFCASYDGDGPDISELCSSVISISPRISTSVAHSIITDLAPSATLPTGSSTPTDSPPPTSLSTPSTPPWCSSGWTCTSTTTTTTTADSSADSSGGSSGGSLVLNSNAKIALAIGIPVVVTTAIGIGFVWFRHRRRVRQARSVKIRTNGIATAPEIGRDRVG